MVSPSWANAPTIDAGSNKTPRNDYAVKHTATHDTAAKSDEVAAAILYLCGASAANVTGSNLLIDGSSIAEPSFA